MILLRVLILKACLFIVLQNCIFSNAQEINPVKILQTMSEKALLIKTIEYNALMRERINNKYVDKISFFKINVSPFKIYVRESFIGIKIEGLYNDGYNNNKMIISTIGFPWVQTNLDPFGNKIRNNHHHTIFETGFNYFVSIVEDIIINKKNKTSISYNGEEMMNGRKCYKITITNDSFKYVNYTVKPGENLTDIAKRLHINDYMMLELNPNIKDYYDVKPGQKIKIPNMYAKSLVLFIDKNLLLPIQINISDDKGLYAAYSYNNLLINKEFAWNEFSTIFKEYHFR